MPVRVAPQHGAATIPKSVISNSPEIRARQQPLTSKIRAAFGLGEAAEVEHARMNALAGGPTNARDAELLERYGCYSGTASAFCQRLAHPRRYYRARRHVYRH
jgi:hypothetical protein